jgi:hypothetical protein
MSETVFVVNEFYEFDGYTEPRWVFASRESAEKYAADLDLLDAEDRADGVTGARIFEMVVRP